MGQQPGTPVAPAADLVCLVVEPSGNVPVTAHGGAADVAGAVSIVGRGVVTDGTMGETNIVETGAGVLFYRATDGMAVTADVDSEGRVTTRANTQEYLSPDWSALVSIGGNILFYNKTTGDGAVGHIVQPQETISLPGLVHTDQSLPHLFSTGWTSVYPIVVPSV